MRRVALVTGGTRGIGLGVARSLAAEGFDLALCGVREEAQVTGVLAELRAKGGEVRYVQADIASRDDRARLVAAVRAAFGRLNLLVNNAGVAPAVRADLLEAGEESFDRLLGVNLKGPYFLTQAIARWMMEQKQQAGYQGAIVFVTSMSAEAASPNRGEYCVSKAGLAMTARLFAVRLAGVGDPRVRGPAGHHPHRHDGGGRREVRPADRRGPRSPRAAGASPRTWAAWWRRSRAATPPTRRAPSSWSTAASRSRDSRPETGMSEPAKPDPPRSAAATTAGRSSTTTS